MSAKAFVIAMAVSIVVIVIAIVSGIFLGMAREEGDRMACAGNLRSVALGLQNYHDTYQRFPPAQLDGHSWRIRVNPQMIASAYYSLYRFEESWNSEWNHELEKRGMPGKGEPDESVGEVRPARPYWMANTFWQCPSIVDAQTPFTSYLLLVGAEAVGLPDEGRTLDDITDDPATTILVAETASRDIEWLEPKDFDVETMSFQVNDPSRPSISSNHVGGAHVAFCDGHVEFLSEDLPPEVVKAMITIAGGEIIKKDANAPGGYKLLPAQEDESGDAS